MSSAPDDVLTLLRQRGHSPDPAALESLMRGVAAAPEGLAGPEWVELVDPAADPALAEALQAWRRDLSRGDNGLGGGPAPARRLADLRAELKRRGLDGFMVPRADEHQGEYVPRGKFSAIQRSGESSGTWCGANAAVSTWARTASV